MLNVEISEGRTQAEYENITTQNKVTSSPKVVRVNQCRWNGQDTQTHNYEAVTFVDRRISLGAARPVSLCNSHISYSTYA
jgi:hypothetical protein